MIPVVTAGECDYGSVHAWFQIRYNQWENATAHPTLKPGDKFQIKIVISTRADLQVFFVKLHEFGTPVYEVLAGPSRLEELLEYRGAIRTNQSFTYEWTLRVRPTTTWTQGIAPLELFTQFNRNDSEECKVDFDIITAYIIPAIQDDIYHKENQPPHSILGGCLPGVHGECVLAALFMVFFLMMLKIRMYEK
jgi:sarcinarray family protein